MIDNIDFSIKQEDNSCRVAITGLSYNSNCNDLNANLVQLSKDALEDDGFHSAAVKENLNILICNCSVAKLISTEQLFSALQLSGKGVNKNNFKFFGRIRSRCQSITVISK